MPKKQSGPAETQTTEVGSGTSATAEPEKVPDRVFNLVASVDGVYENIMYKAGDVLAVLTVPGDTAYPAEWLCRSVRDRNVRIEKQ